MKTILAFWIGLCLTLAPAGFIAVVNPDAPGLVPPVPASPPSIADQEESWAIMR